MSARVNAIEEEVIPAPPAASQYDVRRMYRIVSGEDLAYADSIADARLIAGEWLVVRDRLVIITRQVGLPRRWQAHLRPARAGQANDVVVGLRELFADPHPEDVGSRRQLALAAQIDAHAAIKRALSAASRRVHNRRGIVCVDPPRAFASLVDAARWVRVSKQSLAYHLKRRSGQCGGFVFFYADVFASMLKNKAAWAAHPNAREYLAIAGQAVEMSQQSRRAG